MNYFKNKKILITGTTGLLGTNLYNRLTNLNLDIRRVYNTRRPRPLIGDFICGDLRDANICNAATKDVDIVIHTAASTSGAAVMDKTPLVHVTPNLIMTANLLEAAFNNKVKKFIFFASTTGYPQIDRPVIEEDMFCGDPFDKYFSVGWTKRSLEKLCQIYDRLGMSCIVLRPSNIYGPHDKFDPERSHVLPSLIRKAVQKQNPFEIWGNGEDERDLIYVDEMVDAVLLAAEKLDRYDPINIGCGKVVSVNHIAKTILNITNFNPTIKYISGPQMIPKREVVVDKAKRLLGFETKVSLETGLRLTIDWYKNNVH